MASAARSRFRLGVNARDTRVDSCDRRHEGACHSATLQSSYKLASACDLDVCDAVFFPRHKRHTLCMSQPRRRHCDRCRDAHETVKKLLPRVRPGGLICAHNINSRQANPEFVKAATTNLELETVL